MLVTVCQSVGDDLDGCSALKTLPRDMVGNCHTSVSRQQFPWLSLGRAKKLRDELNLVTLGTHLGQLAVCVHDDACQWSFKI